MPKHVHADIMLEYAMVAMETDRPWEEFEYRSNGEDEWRQFDSGTLPPTWNKVCQYRRRSKKLIIGGREINAPMTKPPAYRETVFVVCPAAEEYFIQHVWTDSYMNKIWLERRMCHLSKENAIEHAKALIGISS